MLAEVARRRSSWLRSLTTARRRSSWLRSLTTARRLSRPLHLQATARPREDEEEDEEDGAKGPRGRGRPDAHSLSFHLQLHADVGPSRGNATVVTGDTGREKELPRRTEDVKLRAEAGAGEFPSLISSGSPAKKNVERARASLHKMARELADPRAVVDRETGFQRARRQLKAATGKLDRMLYHMRQRQEFAQVEAVAFIWEQEFPHFAGQRKHWSVICEHYAWALNSQQRFQDVVDKFSSCFREQGDAKRAAEGASLLTPRLAQSVFVALGHVRDATGALQLLDTMRRHDVHVTKVSYFHALNALLHDESFTDFESVMHMCEEIVTTLPGENVPLSLLPMIMMTAAACGESERAMKFYSHPPDMPMSMFTEFRFEICLQQLNQLGEDAMLMEMYRNLMLSSKASRDIKERVSKYLFRKRVAFATSSTRSKRLRVACEILEIMDEHKIPVSHHAIYPLMRTLMLESLPFDGEAGNEHNEEDKMVRLTVKGAGDIRKFFLRYTHSLDWNAFALCEAIVAGVRAHRADLVDNLFVYALDSGMPIKYAALEQVVVYYYRLGLINDLERVSDMVHALRLNKHIPLGIAVTEIGMAANLRLHRYNEVVILFEDFSSLDGERRRVLQRRFMLKTVLEAYTHLGRGDEAMAIQAVLNQTESNLLDGNGSIDEEETEEELTIHDDDEEDDGEERKRGDDSESDEVGEQERLPFRRFNR
ncbi:uncharacterized protein KRP23_13207 [Phytophthora ramorum]|uniref:uncharacterized protein n=1 Tax=Phytophthora ramorum TaxID=164328 RepID=UPI00309C44E6|nr:hypothetical protein KRP23_13207 [Phytophthora ramorum]